MKEITGQKCNICENHGVTCVRKGVVTLISNPGQFGFTLVSVNGQLELLTPMKIDDCPVVTGESNSMAIASRIIQIASERGASVTKSKK